MKPLARWTIGPVMELGPVILKESLKQFRRVYPEFDMVVCYNNIEEPDVDVETYHQTAIDSPFDMREENDGSEDGSSPGSGWKLFPPRLRLGAHELFIDNDVVIGERLPAIDEWLESNTGLISEGVGRKRMYGCFDHLVQPLDLHVCAGFFGLPPEFDFGRIIGEHLRDFDKPFGGWDEQGLTAAIVTSIEDCIIVPLDQMWISEDHVPFPGYMPPAVHFVGSNRKPWHRGWKSYLGMKIKMF